MLTADEALKEKQCTLEGQARYVNVQQGSPIFLGPRATFWILIKVGAHLS